MKQRHKTQSLLFQHKRLYLMYNIPVLLTYKRPYIVSYPRPQELTYQVPIQTDSDHLHQGLDCSGQGNCQPEMDNTKGEEMQAYLVKANRQPSAKKRRQNQQKIKNKET